MGTGAVGGPSNQNRAIDVSRYCRIDERPCGRTTRQEAAMGEDARDMRLIGLDDLHAARAALAGRLHRTPTFTCATLSAQTDTSLYLKAELLQKTGSFKPRGALNKLLSLSDQERSRGVITISAGNHAQGVAFAARALGTQATVVMPEAAVRSKVDATRSYGAEVILHGTGK